MSSITLEQAREELRQARHREAAARGAARAYQAECEAAGINMLVSQDHFDRFETLTREADEHAETAAQLARRIQEFAGFENLNNRFSLIDGAERVGGGPAGSGRRGVYRTLGHRVTEAEGFRAFHERLAAARSDAHRLQIVSDGFEPIEVSSRDEFLAMLAQGQFLATTVTGGGAASAGPFIQNDLVPGFIEYRMKRPTLAMMVGRGETDSDVVEYVTESAPTHAAAETAEDSAAPESTYPFATNTVNVREITHYVPVTLRALADYGQIRTIINNNLARGVLDRLDTQLASGDGAGQNLEGIYTAVSQAVSAAGLSKSEAIHRAITVVRIAAGVFAEPDWIGMHPNDAEALRLEQDANGQYIFGPPSSGGPFTAWGIPIMQSTVFTDGTPLVGDFEGGATLWVREGLAVTSGLNSDDFTKRRISMLAAMRIAFKTVRPTAFCEVTGF